MGALAHTLDFEAFSTVLFDGLGCSDTVSASCRGCCRAFLRIRFRLETQRNPIEVEVIYCFYWWRKCAVF